MQRFHPGDRAGACRRIRLVFFSLSIVMSLALSPVARAAGEIEAFVARAFGKPPAPAMLWFSPDVRAAVAAQAGWAPDGARVRYWRDGPRTAWVLEHIGKEAPITFGVIVEDDAVVALDVLVYRESRGHEIRNGRWRAQFAGARRGDGAQKLDRPVDNLTGATLSVRAATNVARLALALHRQVENVTR